MNTFCIGARDISWIDLAIVEDGRIVDVERTDGSPETYLAAIDTYLKKHDRTLEGFDRVFVVTGPGSFTASRVSVTIANAIAFSRSLPICGASNDQKIPFGDFLKSQKWDALDVEGTFVVPSYDRPPGITKPKPKSV